ncbi:MAG: hypothetical protein WC867_03680 [Candidatus Pacearchaeota archaeon]|jgi:hypothetical protein
MGGGTSTGYMRNEESSNWKVVDFKYGVSPTEARGLIRYLTANLTGNCSISLTTNIQDLFEKPNSLKIKSNTVEERVNASYGVSLEKTGFLMNGEVYRYQDDSSINYTFIQDDSNFPLITHFYRMELSHGNDSYEQLEDSERELATDVKSTVERYFLDKEILRKRK